MRKARRYGFAARPSIFYDFWLYLSRFWGKLYLDHCYVPNFISNRKRSAIMEINSEFVGLPFRPETVYPK